MAKPPRPSTEVIRTPGMENGAALRDPLELPEPAPAAAGEWLAEA